MNDEIENELPLELAPGVELVAYTRDQSCGAEVLEANGLLADYDEAMVRVAADIQAQPDAVQIWIDIFPRKAERLLFAVTLIYLGSSDCRGSQAVARYAGRLKAARDCLYRWSERNAMAEVEKFAGSPAAAVGLN